MARLHIVVEGQSEETFVNRILREPLAQHGVYVVARCVQTSRRRGQVFRGGLLDFARARHDLCRWMREQKKPDAYFSTMFDLYGLPSDFPGFQEARKRRDPYRKVEDLEGALSAEMNDKRFIPYIQLHEFEALLLCDPSRFSIPFPDAPSAVNRLADKVSRLRLPSPELIDDGKSTAPSKRIIKELPQYEKQKVIASAAVSAEIGLAVMRKQCPHFDAWLKRIESIGDDAPVQRTSI